MRENRKHCTLTVHRSRDEMFFYRLNVFVRLFYFYIFQKKFTEIYFSFHILQFYTPTARRRGGRGPTARGR